MCILSILSLRDEETKVPEAICPVQGHITEKRKGTERVALGARPGLVHTGGVKEAEEPRSLADGRNRNTSGWVFEHRLEVP